ncbi:MAG TPA: tRNA (adenosine(37)-N6)-threonylcarbamoyltransferase complex dimerization subunit type 1 TsaB [Methylomirabilota bacterium]|nr:tRNA (adenosine(37)-N6)-threonylcarbamoyltransferase complex dimerization subunit type 1 TsaB [Methylomirabilota bacterium]
MILVIDTATSQAVVGLGGSSGGHDGRDGPAGGIAVRTWPVRHQHGETLLPTLTAFLAEQGATLADLRGIVVGTGPGAFTGLRVGLATAKGLAHGLGLPIVGVSTAEGLLEAARVSGDAGDVDAGEGDAGDADAAISLLLLLPAGPNDRVAVRSGQLPELLPGGDEPTIDVRDRIVAVDLEGRAPADAVARGDAARNGLARALFRLGAARLAAGELDDLAGLVPEYVTLPRGIRASSGEVTWSRDHR